MDNLTAHQAYYCLKRNELEVRRCSKCRGIAEPGHQCSPSGNLTGWKCPCCDVVSSTASAAQRHMESHTGVKAYRCTICRYKGNTLRGMRTHIRMHFDKRSPDLQVRVQKVGSLLCVFLSYLCHISQFDLIHLYLSNRLSQFLHPLLYYLLYHRHFLSLSIPCIHVIIFIPSVLMITFRHFFRSFDILQVLLVYLLLNLIVY